MKIEITRDQAEVLKDLIDIWFFREVRENKNIDNTMWAWNVLDIYKQCQNIIDGNIVKPSNEIEKLKDSDFTIGEISEIHLKVKTKSDESKMMSWFNLKNPRDSLLEQQGNSTDNHGTKISFKITCDGYDACITDA